MSERLENLLDDGEATLWRQYLELEHRGVRKRALAVLDEFVTALSVCPPKHRAAFARAFCGLATLTDAKIPVRYPLVVGLICPYLAAASARRNISALRWMARLHDRHAPLDECWHMFDPNMFDPLDLLREILRQDPADSAARRLLISEPAYWFDYAIHETPLFVLYIYGTADVATISQCHKMLKELDEFRDLVAAEDLTEDCEGRITKWAFHFRGYADYLSNREEHASYADYIKRHSPES